MIKRIIAGGIITLTIGGAGYTISQSDIVDNFSNETGMSKQQAKEYVEDSQKDLESFDKIGSSLKEDGSSIKETSDSINCVDYRYDWESSSLSCESGKRQLAVIALNEQTLGSCYIELGTDLGDAGRAKIQECITDIDALNDSYDYPIAKSLIDSKDITDIKNANLYNKSVFKSALQSSDR